MYVFVSFEIYHNLHTENISYFRIINLIYDILFYITCYYIFGSYIIYCYMCNYYYYYHLFYYNIYFINILLNLIITNNFLYVICIFYNKFKLYLSLF